MYSEVEEGKCQTLCHDPQTYLSLPLPADFILHYAALLGVARMHKRMVLKELVALIATSPCLWPSDLAFIRDPIPSFWFLCPAKVRYSCFFVIDPVPLFDFMWLPATRPEILSLYCCWVLPVLPLVHSDYNFCLITLYHDLVSSAQFQVSCCLRRLLLGRWSHFFPGSWITWSQIHQMCAFSGC